MSEVRAIRVVVRGRVQGVGFRYWTRRKAGQLGLTGWVRNRSDGTVEAMIAGPPDGVAEMLAALRHGPRAAEVVGVEELPAESHEAGEGGFEERDTV